MKKLRLLPLAGMLISMQDPTPTMINTPVRPIVTDGVNLWFKGEAILWQAVEDNLSYATKGTNTASHFSQDFKNLEFDWNCGFRLGTGYNIPRDGWDITLDWTHIHNEAHGSVHAGHESLFETYVNTANVNTTGTHFHGKWHNHLDQIDLNLGREFLVGKHLAIRPNGGMRTAWIHQKYAIDYDFSSGPDQDVDLKNRFWGFGFVGGIDSDWRLGAGFSIYGNADLAILLGFFDVDETGKAGGSTLWKVSNSFRTGKPIFDLALGLKWNHLFVHDSLGLTLKVGYEYHLYFNQNQFLQSNGSATLDQFIPIGGDLSYQGVTFSAQLDF